VELVGYLGGEVDRGVDLPPLSGSGKGERSLMTLFLLLS